MLSTFMASQVGEQCHCDMLDRMSAKSILDHCVCTPGSFAGLMALYEQNYHYLNKLLEDSIQDLPGEMVSRVPAHLPLRLRVIERFPYTTTLSLTYLFRESGGQQTDPDILIRVYHDATVAEVIGFGESLQQFTNSTPSQPVDSWVLERKWQLNRFLEKWLEYCLVCGHRFPGDRKTR